MTSRCPISRPSWLTNSGRRRNESGEIAEAAFVWGAGGRCSADHRPAGGVRHAYHGGLFAADVGAGVVAAVFTLPVVRPGAPAAYRPGGEQSEGAPGPVRGVYFCSFGAEDPVGDRQLLAPDRRWSGGDPLRAGRGGGAGGDRSAVPGAAAGAWRPDHPWR